jgi:hypothetical protein
LKDLKTNHHGAHRAPSREDDMYAELMTKLTDDDFIGHHFQEWLDNYHEDDRPHIGGCVCGMVRDYPELVGDRSWPEILALGERRGQ